MVSVEDIRDIVLSEVALESKVETLIRFTNNAGGLDNITVALLHITEEAQRKSVKFLPVGIELFGKLVAGEWQMFTLQKI